MKNFVRIGILLNFVLWVTGCATTEPIALYDGKLKSLQETAIIVAPEEIEVLSVDGKSISSGYLRSGTQFSLLPGEHVFTMRYVQLFKLNESDHEVVRSQKVAMRLTVLLGQTYHLAIPPQNNIDTAKKFGKDPVITLVNAQNEEVAKSVLMKSYAEASLFDTLTGAEAANQSEAKQTSMFDKTSLQVLKDIWHQASPTDQKAFKEWLQQQP
jgi:uncharacterized protein YccT (UPF0319 family)